MADGGAAMVVDPLGGPSGVYRCLAVGRGKPYEGSYAPLDQQYLYYDSGPAEY